MPAEALNAAADGVVAAASAGESVGLPVPDRPAWGVGVLAAPGRFAAVGGTGCTDGAVALPCPETGADSDGPDGGAAAWLLGTTAVKADPRPADGEKQYI